ncbi:MAG: MarR family transcriptional regulator [Deltaproteobacteria bacterium]|nr:MarR family transcriptional regulator [Deltaproteobacteria bacterium]
MSTPLRDVRRLRAAIRVLERELALDLRSQTSCCGVTTAQCHLLLEIDRRGPATGGELALALSLDKSTLSRTLDGLAEARLVAREPHPEDGRAQRVTLTAAGREAVERIDLACDGDYRALLDGVAPGHRQRLVAAAEELAEAMRQARQARGGDRRGKLRKAAR